MLWEMERTQQDDSLPIFDVLLNPERIDEMNMLMAKIDKASLALFAEMNFTSAKTKRVLLSVLWFSALPCNQLVIHCTWKGRTLPCGQIFKVIPTDAGFCCSFNHVALTDMLRNSTFARTIEEVERRHIDMLKKNHDSHLSEWGEEISANLSDLGMQPKKGKQNGLTVVLDMRGMTLSASTLNQDFLGVQAAIGPRDEVGN